MDMGLFVIGSLEASGHPLNLWLESHNLLDHSPPQYTLEVKTIIIPI